MELVPALSKYLRLEGETSSAFVGEIKNLTNEDRRQFVDAFRDEGIEIEE